MERERKEYVVEGYVVTNCVLLMCFALLFMMFAKWYLLFMLLFLQYKTTTAKTITPNDKKGLFEGDENEFKR